MKIHIIRYQEIEHKNIEFEQVIAGSEEEALRLFTQNNSHFIEGTPTVLNMEEYREIRERLGLSVDGLEELPEWRKQLLDIYASEEFQKYIKSGGYDY